jgi:hypothetical protein
VEAHQHPPQQIILDLDVTDDPLHGHQEGRRTTSRSTRARPKGSLTTRRWREPDSNLYGAFSVK